MTTWPQWLSLLVDSGAFASISPSAAKVVVALAKHANKAGRCWPSRDVLAMESGTSLATVHRALDTLKVEGWLVVETREQRSAVLVLTVPRSFTGEASAGGESFTREASDEGPSFTGEASPVNEASPEASPEASREASPVNPLKGGTREPENQRTNQRAREASDRTDPDQGPDLVGLGTDDGENCPGWLATELEAANVHSGHAEIGRDILEAVRAARARLIDPADGASVATEIVRTLARRFAPGSDNPGGVFRARYRDGLEDLALEAAERVTAAKRPPTQAGAEPEHVRPTVEELRGCLDDEARENLRRLGLDPGSMFAAAEPNTRNEVEAGIAERVLETESALLAEPDQVEPAATFSPRTCTVCQGEGEPCPFCEGAGL